MSRIPALALLAAAGLLPGCLLAAGAAIGAGIVHAAGEDTAEVRVRATVAEAYAAARDEILRRGVVETSDPVAAVLEGSIDDSSVRVVVVDDGEGMARVRVRSRRISGPGPDMDTANSVAVAIVRGID